jgi:hypothetical protein
LPWLASNHNPPISASLGVAQAIFIFFHSGDGTQNIVSAKHELHAQSSITFLRLGRMKNNEEAEVLGHPEGHQNLETG